MQIVNIMYSMQLGILVLKMSLLAERIRKERSCSNQTVYMLAEATLDMHSYGKGHLRINNSMFYLCLAFTDK